MQKLTQTAAKLLEQCLGLRAGETLLIVSDGTRPEIGEALFQAGEELQAEPTLMTMRPRIRSGEEPPAIIAHAMAEAQVVLCVTEHSLTHTQARKLASSKGARIATMPGITLDMFEHGPITADFEAVAQLSRVIAEKLTGATHARIEKNGSVFECSLAGRAGIASTGIYTEPGQSGNLPSGEAYIAPLEGNAHGVLLVDGSIVGLGLLRSPIRLIVQDGLLVRAEGERAEEWLAKLGASKEARNVAELGIGTNPQARLTGVILEDEKAAGTVHVAFGSNATFGGTIQAGVHMDGVITQPTLYLDDQLIMKDGALV